MPPAASTGGPCGQLNGNVDELVASPSARTVASGAAPQVVRDQSPASTSASVSEALEINKKQKNISNCAIGAAAAATADTTSTHPQCASGSTTEPRAASLIFPSAPTPPPTPKAAIQSSKDFLPATGAEALLAAAMRAGVHVCFANPGTTEMWMVSALDYFWPAIRPVLCLHENVATGAADGAVFVFRCMRQRACSGIGGNGFGDREIGYVRHLPQW